MVIRVGNKITHIHRHRHTQCSHEIPYNYEDGKQGLCKPGVLRGHCEGVLGHWAARPGQLRNRRRGGRPGKLLPRGSVRAPLGAALSSADNPLDCCERPAAARRGRVATVCAPERDETGNSLPAATPPTEKTNDPTAEPEKRNVAQAQREARWGRDACRGNGPIRGCHGRALREGPLREPAWGARQDRPMRKPACGGVAGRANERADLGGVAMRLAVRSRGLPRQRVISMPAWTRRMQDSRCEFLGLSSSSLDLNVTGLYCCLAFVIQGNPLFWFKARCDSLALLHQHHLDNTTGK